MHEFSRIIDQLEPNWVVIENVPGLLSSQRGRDFATVIRWLAERGYGVAWRILDSQYFGVAQRRRRVFIVASFGNGNASEILFEREGVRWDIEKGRKTGEDIAYSIRANPSHSCDKGDGGINQTLVMSSGQPQRVNQVTTHRMTAFGEYSDDGKAGAVKARDYKDATDLIVLNDQGGSQMSVTENVSATLRSQEHGHQPIVWEMQHASEVYREVWNAQNRIEFYKKPVSPTLQSRMGTGGNNVPLIGVRRLTPTECERLQGFPDGWTDGQADSHRYKQMGNAVTVNVAEWIGKRIKQSYLQEQK